MAARTSPNLLSSARCERGSSGRYTSRLSCQSVTAIRNLDQSPPFPVFHPKET
jgi:hypothetical protein